MSEVIMGIGDSLYNNKEYFPIVSPSILKEGIRDGENIILQSTLRGLIVKFTTAEEKVNYQLFSDFFIVYRNFMSGEDLLELLRERFEWGMQLRSSSKTDEKLKANVSVALVRTFVLLRHWVANYFAQDFVLNSQLRGKFLQFVNEFQPIDNFTDNIIVSLKRIWIHNVQLMWNDVGNMVEKNNIKTRADWLEWKIQDIGTETDGSISKSRLSFHAVQKLSNPIHRNESILSLSKMTKSIPLPRHSRFDNNLQTQRLRKRTGSMFLFPENASNDLAKPCQSFEKVRDSDPSDSSNNSTHDKKIMYLSDVSNFSKVMRDVGRPLTPSVNMVIPPTPAKKIEFILQTSYTSELANQAGVLNMISKEFKNGNNTSVSSNQHEEANHKGIIGLIFKWKMNHNRKTPSTQVQKNPPQVEKLIKYVFSISSIDANITSVQDLVSSKYDILSARTIDEVEYLISVEKELLSELEKEKISVRASNNKEDSQEHDFSVLDNLNLYQTVSSIANSVISLSKTLNTRPHKSTNNLLSPSLAAVERRNMRNSAPITYPQDSSQLSVTNVLLGSPTFENTDGPKRLIFHNSARNSPTKMAIESNTLKGIGENCFSNNSRDSMATFNSESSINTFTTDKDDELNVFMPGSQGLKRKKNIGDLRKFNFEANSRQGQNFLVDSEDSLASISKTNTDVATRSSKNCPNVKRPASGRISITRNSNENSAHINSENLPKSPDIMQNEVFLERDKALANNENDILQLEKETNTVLSVTKKLNSKRTTFEFDSDSQSIATNLLFSSTNASPEKMMATETSIVEEFEEDITPSNFKAKDLKLSHTPSIRSIASIGSSTSVNGEVERTSVEIITSPRVGTKYSLANQDTHDTFEEDLEDINFKSNKYLFSPDNDFDDYASPEKNLEELKQQFIDHPENEDNASDNKIEPLDNNSKSSSTSSVSMKDSNGFTEERLAEILNGTENNNEMALDPVNLALMKLEGTYDKEEEQEEDAKSLRSSEVAKEVENFKIIQPDIDSTTARKRQSMFIQRRRNTMIEMSNRTSLLEEEVEQKLKTADQQILELLDEYQLTDPRLMLTNLDDHIPFILMYDSESIARQLTLIEREILSEVDWKDLIDLNMHHQLPEYTSWLQLLVQNENLSGVDLAIARFNLTVDWIISEIIMTQDTKIRRYVIQRFIHIADHCKKLQNYNTLMEIVLALNSLVVQRLTDTWRLVEPGDLLIWEGLKMIPSLDKNYHNIRQLLNDVDPMEGCIPFLVVYISDLALNAEKRDWIVPKEILNYYKFQVNVQIVKNYVQKMQWSKFYNFEVNKELLSKCVYITSLSHQEITSLIG